MLWQDSFAVGIAEIDEQHQELFAQLEKLMDAAIGDPDHVAMEEIVIFLDQYTKDHFSGEEQRMVESQYPGYQDHKEMHREFIQELAYLKEELQSPSGKHPSLTNLIGFLSEWLIQHILDMDQQMGNYLIRHGMA
ncbi:MAG: hemerythrin family protein [Magnetococcales bacterium]|nr:hemerythrin family protein [Magnetococcales bacterium]NGZ26760.1 hemerythrin family protein [Magnetococcales bacterium]